MDHEAVVESLTADQDGFVLRTLTVPWQAKLGRSRSLHVPVATKLRTTAPYLYLPHSASPIHVTGTTSLDLNFSLATHRTTANLQALKPPKQLTSPSETHLPLPVLGSDCVRRRKTRLPTERSHDCDLAQATKLYSRQSVSANSDQLTLTNALSLTAEGAKTCS
jgi:hypothetical protein